MKQKKKRFHGAGKEKQKWVHNKPKRIFLCGFAALCDNKKARKSMILAYAGLLSDLTQQEERQFDESIKRRSLFMQREVELYDLKNPGGKAF